jgi:uncharacterized protein YndB with AHSA1/START domain
MNNGDDRLLERFGRRMARLESELPAAPPPMAAALDRPVQVRSRARTWVALAASLVVLAGVGGMLIASWSGLDPRTPAGPSPAAPSPTASPPGSAPPWAWLTWFETVTLGEDRRTVHLSFIGGPEYSPTDPCSDDYDARAEIVGDTLVVALFGVDRPKVPLPPMAACPGAGYQRSLDIELTEPFTGYRVEDLAGYVHFLSRPEGLIGLSLPDGWLLREERNISMSPTGRWQRTYSPLARLPAGGIAGRLELYQAFDGSTYVLDGDDRSIVSVNGAPAVLWRSFTEGEFGLQWMHGRDGLAIVASEADFSDEQLIAMAETATPPVKRPAVRAEDTEDGFRLVFEMDSTTVPAGAPIRGWATLELVETETRVVDLVVPANGPFGFRLQEVGGPRQEEPFWSSECDYNYGLGPASPLLSPLGRSGWFDPTDPDADLRRFLEGRDVVLPAGEWDITAVALFYRGFNCDGREQRLEATIRVTVTDDR